MTFNNNSDNTTAQHSGMGIMRALNDDYYAIYILRDAQNIMEPYFVKQNCALTDLLGEQPEIERTFSEVFPALMHEFALTSYQSVFSRERVTAELQENGTLKHVFYMNDGSGEFVHIEMRFSLYHEDAENYVIFALRDVDSEMRASMDSASRLEQAVKKYKQADYDLRRDFLTGLYNRFDLFEMIKDSLSGAARPIIAMFMLDIDNYKLFNDFYGHVAGDQCLQMIGESLKRFSVNRDARFYRYGGEEILGICFDVALDPEKFAQELLDEIRALKITHKGSKTGYLTVSIGYTTDNARYEKMIDKADKALYMAKKSGKNRAVSYESISVAGRLENDASAMSEVLNISGSQSGDNEKKLATDNLIASFHLNLSHDRCFDALSSYQALSGLATGETTAEQFFAAAEKLVHPAETARFHERFSLRALLNAYETGISAYSDEFRMRIYDHHYSYLRVASEVYQLPFSGEIEMTFSIVDINTAKLKERISERLVGMNYEFLCLIDSSTGHMTAFQGTTPLELEQLGREELFYHVQGLEVGQELMGMHELMYLERHASLDAVIENLQDNSAYTLMFQVTPDENGVVHYKRLRYAYLDDSRELIMMTREDVTELISKEIDDLTGLHNAEGFHRRVQEWIARNPGRRYRMIQYDFDGFRNINGIFSYEEGNRLLREMGRHMRSNSTEDSFCGHFSADHFARFCAVDNSPTPEEYYDKFISCHFEFLSKYRTTLHAGVYDLCEPDVDSYSMSYRAQLALQSIKGDYKHLIAYYEAPMLSQEIEIQNLLSDFETAIEQEQFQVFFQPQVDYMRQRYIGAEALVRWFHPTMGIVAPGMFIPALERHGLICTLDMYVWEKCCQYLRKWIDQYGDAFEMAVSVNISRIDISTLPLVRVFSNLIKKYSLTPDRLRLEVTESAFISDSVNLVKTVQALQTAGFTVEMDDFGAGYSSLNTLKDIPVDALKLDMQFLPRDAESNERGANILTSVVRMANWLKLPVIAEGVETKTQADYLQSIGCYYMQGFLFSKPLPLAEFEELLAKNSFEDAKRFHDVSLEGVAQFWNADAQSTLLFNSFIGGAAIVEYCNGAAEIVRANPRFIDELGVDPEKCAEFMCDPLASYDEENREKFVHMLLEAIETGQEAQCETRNSHLGVSNEFTWLRATVRMIARNNDRYLFYMQTTNTTREHIAEESAQQQRKIDLVRSEIIVKQMNSVTFEYFIPNGELHFRMRAPDGKVFEQVRSLADGRRQLYYIHPEGMTKIYDELTEFSRHGSNHQIATVEFLSRFWADRWQWSRGHCSCIRNEKGEAYCIVGQIVNIQAEKDKEALQVLLEKNTNKQ
ncbi:MAG: EAL domain-containing protein [Ruminococcaceae bacterium]|nr:EAL domain-containing protein [Oscillospiraceae bacterium]